MSPCLFTCLSVCRSTFLSHSPYVYLHTLALHVTFDFYKSHCACFVCIIFGWSTLQWHTCWQTCNFRGVLLTLKHWMTLTGAPQNALLLLLLLWFNLYLCFLVCLFVCFSKIISDNRFWHLCTCIFIVLNQLKSCRQKSDGLIVKTDRKCHMTFEPKTIRVTMTA